MLDKVKIIYKQVKYANLKIKPNLDIILTVPLKTSKSIIDAILVKRQSWIISKVNCLQLKLQQQTRQLVNGENIEYLGKNYSLKIMESDPKSLLVKLSDNFIEVHVSNIHDFNLKSTLINKWYRSQAEIYFRELIARYSNIVNQPINKIRIRHMKTRWGSCNPIKGYINLNLELIKKSLYAIEYVVFHELVHLIHYNHDKKFYTYIEKYMPDWKVRKNQLKDIR